MHASREESQQAPVMRHVQAPGFLAEKLRRDVLAAVEEILAITKRSPSLEGQVLAILEPLGLRIRALSRLSGVPEVGHTLPVAIDRLAQKLATLDGQSFRELPSFQHFYRGRGERIWTCSTGVFAATRLALEAASKIDSQLLERYLKLDLLPESPMIRRRDGSEL